MVSTKQLNKELPVRAGLFLTAVCCAILAFSGWREWESRRADLAHAEIETRNLAHSVTQYAEDTIELSKAYLVSLVARLEKDGTGPDAIVKLRSVLESRKPTLGRIRGLFAYDEEGDWIATSEKIDLTGLNNGDRDYFHHHKAFESEDIFIGKPVQSRSGGQWIITASKRFNHPDGSFAGVALATIDVAHFSDFFSQFELGPTGSISLLSRDGIVLSRYPEDGGYVGRNLSQSSLFKNLGQRPAEAAYYFKSPLDGRQRISSYKVSSAFPLVALATRTEDDVLANWKQEALGRSAFILALTMLLALAGWYLIRQLLHGQRLLQAIANKEADFRLLAEESSDIVLRIDLDKRIRYVSPSCLRILGWDAAELVNTNPIARINNEDRPRADGAIAALKAGEIEETKIVYRSRKKDGSEIWLETSLRATKGVTGELNGVVAISRDISDHIDLEAQLAALARTDALTGLANRRHFDEKFEEEWMRSVRERTPLSVVLLDVDHFKKYNDRYGHPAGDAALQEVARILDGQGRRPADLVARYGGEEFVLLLPNTDAAGADMLAHQIRRDLAERSLPHASNSPTYLITASLGVASMRPADFQDQRQSLLKRADEALYQAKASGRNQVQQYGLLDSATSHPAAASTIEALSRA